MPSKSPAQHRLMEAVAHDPGFAKKAGIPQSVGQDFAAADKAQGYDHVAHLEGMKRDARSLPAARKRIPR